MMEKYYSLKDAAKMLDISPRTIRRIIDREDIKAHMIGKRIRLTESQINAMIKKWSPTKIIVDELLHK